MTAREDPADLKTVEGALVALARIFHWAGLYGAAHPVLSDRAREVHGSLLACAAEEPGRRLLFGIAPNKVLYRDTFLGEGHELIGRFTESLYLLQVATLEIGPDLTPDGLVRFVASVHAARGAPPSALPFDRSPVPGLRLSAVNYRELLSRRLVSEDPKDDIDLADREDRLWKALLTADVAEEDGEEKRIAREVADIPELLPLIVRRARACPGADAGPERAIPGEVLARLFRRLGDILRGLPEDRRAKLLARLEESVEEPAGEDGEDGAGLANILVSSLTDACSDGEFLDLLGTLLSMESKTDSRIRRIFEILAFERDRRTPLLPKVEDRARESLASKNFFALKTWDTVERLLLSRAEKTYIGADHAAYLDSVSSGEGIAPAGPSQTAAGILSELQPGALLRRSTLILLELLAREKRPEEFEGQIEEIRKLVPNLISRREILLLRTILEGLASLAESVREEWRPRVLDVLSRVDFGQVADAFLEAGDAAEQTRLIPALLADFAGRAVNPVLDRLLAEPDAARRRTLITLAASLGKPAVPWMVARLSHPKWYFVRNLCAILGDIGDPRAVPGLLRATGHEDARVRREAVGALGKLRAPEAVATLGRLLLEEGLFGSGKEDTTRIASANALFGIGGAEAVSFLHRGSEVRRSAVREHCRDLLRTRRGA